MFKSGTVGHARGKDKRVVDVQTLNTQIVSIVIHLPLFPVTIVKISSGHSLMCVG